MPGRRSPDPGTDRRGRAVHRLTLGLGRVVLAGLGHRVVVEGLHHLPRTGPVVLASTHCAYPDPLPLALAVRRAGRWPRFLARHDVWDSPLLGAAMDAMGHVPVDRAAPAGAYLAARRLLSAGELVALFPEAGISYSYAVRPLMRGAVALARETGAPIVPTVVWGTQRTMMVGVTEHGGDPPADWTRGRRFDVRFGEPVQVPPGADLTEQTRALGRLLTTQLEALQREPWHRPRPGELAPWYPAHLGGQAPDRGVASAWDAVLSSAVSPDWGPPLPDGPPAPPRPSGPPTGAWTDRFR